MDKISLKGMYGNRMLLSFKQSVSGPLLTQGLPKGIFVWRISANSLLLLQREWHWTGIIYYMSLPSDYIPTDTSCFAQIIMRFVRWYFDLFAWLYYSKENKANLKDLITATSQVITNWIQKVDFSTCVNLKFDWWPRKITGHFFYTTSSFEHHFKSTGEFTLGVQSGNAKFGLKLATFCPVWPWNLMDDLGKQ